MRVIRVSNVNEALPDGLRWLTNHNGEREPSRNGDVLVSNVPVVTVYDDITHRVLFSPVRDANPFFHVFEALWMLAGRNDLKMISQFNKKMELYSDDGGVTQPAAYGYRWRQYFGYDQLAVICDELRQNPASRRCVLGMWSPGGDRDNAINIGMDDLVAAVNGSADVPCNTQCYFRIQHGQLHMNISCRSNDIYWGAYGANAVHFTMLLEYMAARIGVLPGKLYQYSWNYHMYPAVVGDEARIKELILDCEKSDLYKSRLLNITPLVSDVRAFDEQLPHVMELIDPDSDGRHAVDHVAAITEPFLEHVAVPMWLAWGAHKQKDYGQAESYARRISSEDWRMACIAWLERRDIKHRERLRAAAAEAQA